MNETAQSAPSAGDHSWRWRKARELGAVVCLCFVIWILRRPHQLLQPYVWVEESQILREYIHHGWLGAIKFAPAGYLIMPVNLLLPFSAWISFIHLPALLYVFATAVFAVTILLIVLPDSDFGDSHTMFAMAVALALCPVNPEVYGVFLYSFWWVTLWPLIILGWKRDLWWWRVPLLAIAALSSPAAGALFVLYAVSYLVNRRRRDLVSCAILLCGFILESSLLLTSTRASALHSTATPRAVAEQSLRTGGFFLSWWFTTPIFDRVFVGAVGFALFGWLGLVATRGIRQGSWDQPFLYMALVMFVIFAAVPAPLLSNPQSAGPRYYFLPFVGIFWCLIQIIGRGYKPHIRLAWPLLIAGSLGLPATFSRTAETTVAKLSWRAEIQKCERAAAPINVPIYFDGSNTFWALTMTPAECRRYLR